MNDSRHYVQYIYRQILYICVDVHLRSATVLVAHRKNDTMLAGLYIQSMQRLRLTFWDDRGTSALRNRPRDLA